MIRHRAAHQNMFVNSTNKYASRYTGKAVGIPGEVLGYFAAKDKYGSKSLTMAQLMEPTINMCEDTGVPVTRSLLRAFKSTSKRLLESSEPWR